MRSDLAKLTTEAPRYGGARAHKAKFGGKVRYIPDPEHDYDNEVGGFRSSSRRSPVHRGAYKSFSDVLGPLRGVIRKNVGRPWDEVYSEFCQFLDRRSVSGIHIFGHLMDYVTTKGLYEGADGVVYEYQAGVSDDRVVREWDRENKRYIEKPNPNGSLRLAVDTPVQGYYVHPTTGILCDADGGKRWRYVGKFPHDKPKPKPVNYIPLAYGYETVEGVPGFYGSYTKKYCSEWYERELCGRRPRSKFYAWFHYEVKETTKFYWDRIAYPIAKNAHFTGEEIPYVDAVKERIYKMHPDKYVKKADGFWYARREETKSKTTKRSVNRKEMVRIRELIAKGKGSQKGLHEPLHKY